MPRPSYDGLCISCNVMPVKYKNTRCRQCQDKPWKEGRERLAKENASREALKKRQKERERIRAQSRPKSPPASNEATIVIGFIAGIYLSYEGHGIGQFLLLGSIVMAGLQYGSKWWDNRKRR